MTKMIYIHLTSKLLEYKQEILNNAIKMKISTFKNRNRQTMYLAVYNYMIQLNRVQLQYVSKLKVPSEQSSI